MNAYILGKKLGMTQIFDKDGTVIPVTVIEAGPCVVTQVKSVAKEGYSAVQVGFGQAKAKNTPKPEAGHLKASGTLSKTLCEFRVTEEANLPKVGDGISVSAFSDVEKVVVSGISKGKGFAGVIKRHHHHSGPETHGSDHHRKPGSMGSMYPQHTLKGHKLPGHMGAERITVSGLKVVQIDDKNNLLMLRGAIPGSNGSLIEIRGAK